MTRRYARGGREKGLDRHGGSGFASTGTQDAATDLEEKSRFRVRRRVVQDGGVPGRGGGTKDLCCGDRGEGSRSDRRF